LRLWGIGSESYWLDEAISVNQAQESFLKSMELVKEDVHLPLYISVLNIWVHLFGTSEIMTRLLSVIFGVISIYVIFLLGKKLFNKDAGLYSSILLALSVIAIYYSQETRLYSLFVLLVMMSFYFFIDLFKENKFKTKALYFLFSLLMLYTHLFSFLVLFVQNIYYLLMNFRDRKRLVQWFIMQAGLGLLFLPWVSVLLKQMKKAHYLSWISLDLMKIYYTFFDFFNHLAIFLIFIGLLIYVFKKYKVKEKNNLILLGLWALLPIIIVILYSLFFNSIYHTRYLLFVLPAFYLIFAWSIVKIPRIYGIALLSIVIVVSLPFIFIQQQSLDKDNWREVSSFVKDNVGKEDYIFIHPYYHQYAFSYYHDKECFGVEDFYSCNFNRYNVLSLNWRASCCEDNTMLTSTNEYNELKYYVNGTIWLLNIRPEMYYNNNNLFEYFNSRKKITFSGNFSGIEVYRFE
jgi:uncharacterized membrane protein